MLPYDHQQVSGVKELPSFDTFPASCVRQKGAEMHRNVMEIICICCNHMGVVHSSGSHLLLTDLTPHLAQARKKHT